ncbi:uncharacterized protein Triagg1_7514 [Trichoderma aggressivum f. europaeum]|uniref:Uncharacterized protein n=1 Tax=Trichoderma aggressivum f. europaeum TaxID=173218 RepID=A0AAE1J5Q4_9HYPO|nr:hypothetical protein Triagg1_7514 [Trichoderma aggressivum f. europaeum]
MSVIVVAIILVLLILAQYTKVLDRKKPANGLDDPENALNAGKIEKLNQKAPTQSFKSWKEKSEEATDSVKQGTTFVCNMFGDPTGRRYDSLAIMRAHFPLALLGEMVFEEA